MATETGDAVDTVDIGRLRDFAARALGAVGMPDDHAGFAADAMAWSQLHGHPHHSVSGGRLRQCLSRIQLGGSNPRAKIAVGRPDAAFAVIDGDNALGLVAGVVAMQAAIQRAERFGIGMVVVRDISTLAALGYYATLAIDAEMIGVVITNGPPLVGAPEGARPVICNQAHAIGCPAGERSPFLYDSAISVMSTVAIGAVHERGGLLPEGVLRDSEGKPTRDPSPEVWRTGMLSAIGGYRGFRPGTRVRGADRRHRRRPRCPDRQPGVRPVSPDRRHVDVHRRQRDHDHGLHRAHRSRRPIHRRRPRVWSACRADAAHSR